MILMMKICSRGHTFNKTSDCPVCPICWPGQKKKILESDLPEGLASPALKALSNHKIKKLSDLKKYTKEVAEFHGIGPNALKKLSAALSSQGMCFKKMK